MTRLVGSTISAIGTSATLVVSDPRHLDQSLEILAAEIDAIDRACSRFRADSEIARVNSAGGRAVAVTGLLLEAIEVALRAAAVTDGVVDPTVGKAMRIIGYDRDFSTIPSVGPPLRWGPPPVPGWGAIELDSLRSTVRVPAGVELDLGATAKALCADRAAAREDGTSSPAGARHRSGGDLRCLAGRSRRPE